jgi:hypothetical protein
MTLLSHERGCAACLRQDRVGLNASSTSVVSDGLAAIGDVLSSGIAKTGTLKVCRIRRSNCTRVSHRHRPPSTGQPNRSSEHDVGYKTLRLGPSGNEKDPNHANYDEAKANPYGDLPDALTLKNGHLAGTIVEPGRPEIVEDFEREVKPHASECAESGRLKSPDQARDRSRLSEINRRIPGRLPRNFRGIPKQGNCA